MCWLYDIEAAIKSPVGHDDPATPVAPESIMPECDKIKLIDLEMLVGNLYAAKPKPLLDKKIDKKSAGNEVSVPRSGRDILCENIAQRGVVQ